MTKDQLNQIKQASKFLRYFSLRMSTKAGSGHPTSALSAADLLSTLFLTTLRYDFSNPYHPNNDRLIFSKGHATPLFYSLFALSGAIKTEKLDTYRKFDSELEGHPTPRFRFTEAATGSLGQGLSIGVGLALNAKYLDQVTYRTFVLLGDGEVAEGNVWEAVEIASCYKLDNLIGILDVNRLGQSEETMLGHDLTTYKKRLTSFGWETATIDGHSIAEIIKAYKHIGKHKDKPYMIIAKTIKGKGVSFLEDKNGWHGKPLSEKEYEKAIAELGQVDKKMTITVRKPRLVMPRQWTSCSQARLSYQKGDEVATRQAYGQALARLGGKYPKVVSLDGDVKNSTYSECFKEKFPDRFLEMYIAEQNMVGVAVGLSKRGKIPFVSTFSAFMTRAFDQIRMAALSCANIKFCGSHAGVSIGQDGPSQMGLEDMAMFRAVVNCSVLYPSDAVSTDRLVEEMIRSKGMVYMRTTRPATPVIYDSYERFYIGGCKVHKLKVKSEKLKVKNQQSAAIVAAGITLFEALSAQEELAREGIEVVVIDCYSIKPIDEKTIVKYAEKTSLVVTCEDHWFDGGLGDAVLNVFANSKEKPIIVKLAVKEMPRTGESSQLLNAAQISAKHIVETIRKNIPN